MELKFAFVTVEEEAKIVSNVAELLNVFIDVGVALLVVVYVNVKVGKLSKSVSLNVSLNPDFLVL